MNKKIMILAISIPILCLFIVIVCIMLPWITIGIGIALQPNPPTPEIKYGEFPFKLTYEINGEEKIVEDTIICKFEGFGADEGRGKYRKWKMYLASDNKEDKVFLLNVDKTTNIFYTIGSAEYYMNDIVNGWHVSDYSIVSFDAIFVKSNGLSGTVRAIELLSEYGIRIISFSSSDPIINNFK